MPEYDWQYGTGSGCGLKRSDAPAAGPAAGADRATGTDSAGTKPDDEHSDSRQHSAPALPGQQQRETADRDDCTTQAEQPAPVPDQKRDDGHGGQGQADDIRDGTEGGTRNAHG